MRTRAWLRFCAVVQSYINQEAKTDHRVGAVAAGSILMALSTTVQADTAQEQESWWKNFNLVGTDFRKKTFFKYEKRIRSSGTPEKIFQYFSSVEKDGIKYMTAVDMCRALVAVYPPEESNSVRMGALLGERAPERETIEHLDFLQVFDIDGDNLISFHEYLIVLALISIPLKDIELVFDIVDINSNGVIDRQEFDLVMQHIAKKSSQARKSRGGLRTGLNVGDNEDSGLLVKFFGKDGKGLLKLAEFKSFLEDLQNKLLVLEFMHYDCRGKNSITAKDFARSLFASADIHCINSYLDKVEEMEESLARIRVSRQEFIDFYSIVQYLSSLETALEFLSKTESGITPPTFLVAMDKAVGLKLTPSLTQIIFYLFSDKSGSFNTEEFIRVMKFRR